MEGPGIYFPNWYRNKKREESQPKAQNQKSWCGAQGINNSNKQTDNQNTLKSNNNYHQRKTSIQISYQAETTSESARWPPWEGGFFLGDLGERSFHGSSASSNRGLWRVASWRANFGIKETPQSRSSFSVFLWIKPFSRYLLNVFSHLLIPIRSTGGGQDQRAAERNARGLSSAGVWRPNNLELHKSKSNRRKLVNHDE